MTDIRKELLETGNKIAEEYGTVHEAHCHLNDENSDDPCDCAVRFLVNEVVAAVSDRLEVETLRLVADMVQVVDHDDTYEVNMLTTAKVAYIQGYAQAQADILSRLNILIK